MTKFEITRDTFELKGTYPNGLTVNDLADLNAERHDFCPDLQESFDDLKTAKKVFDETYRKLASTTRKPGWSMPIVEVVFYELNEMEYDEDGELVQSLGGWFAYEPLSPLNEE